MDVVRSGRRLLSSITVCVRPGEHWAVLGPNGAGKSTLLVLMGARLHPTRGEVRVLGHRLGRVDVRELREHLGHVDPRHPLQSPLPVRDVVLTGLTNTPELVPRRTISSAQIDRAEHLIAALGISGRVNTPWPLLSQGERTRALIARALMPAPRLLLLDEPVTGLDLAGREQLLAGLCHLAAEYPELATVTVTHHLEDLPPHTSHALLIREGRALATGPARDVLTSAAVTRCFDHPVTLAYQQGRWAARAGATAPSLPGAPVPIS
ncbi:ATP-binding cassette domain-containing protein [Pseudonocardia kujensis]|uniref:ABC transporter ATP-binding protein n=1 Tax=Pseudonocardia kujensis TaxID=1128675 RepID=UPI001E3224FB|nr:ATP-binding cassette domain-containing protein [Pseudonocardia kujensis]MCE0768484.1 ATP-binding cassette domain-containing protein [Pseudonocardia kujensis]